MQNVFGIFFLILGSNAEICLGKSSDDTKGCNRSNDELITYDDIFGDTVIEHAIRKLLETDKSGSAWISGYPRYSQSLRYLGCYNTACIRYANSLQQTSFHLSDDRNLFRCAEDCTTMDYRYIWDGFIGISDKRCFCLTSDFRSVFNECVVNNSLCGDDRENLYRRVKIPELDAPKSDIITVFYSNGISSITDDDRKKPFFKDCTYYALLEAFLPNNGPCDLGQSFICSDSPPSLRSVRCRNIIEKNKRYCIAKNNKSSLYEAEIYCHRYSDILSMFTPQLERTSPTSMYRLSAVREFVISDEVFSNDKGDCVYAYVGKSDRAIRIGTQACSSKRQSLCKVQISTSHGKNVSDDTIVGVCISTSHGKNVSDDTIVGVSTCIGILTCLIVLVAVIVIWKRRRTTQHQRDARITRALEPRQCDEECEMHDGDTRAQDEDSETVNNEFASVIYSCSDNDRDNHYTSTIQP